MRGSFRKIVKSLLEHWVITLLSSGGIVATFFGWIFHTYLKDWLFSKHTLELLGIYWILIFLAILAIPILLGLVFQFFKKQFIYKEERSIKTVLKGYLRRLAASENDLDLNVTIDYKNLDRKLHIEKGGTKRHIKTVLSEDDTWAIDSEGEDTILIDRNPAEFDLLDND